ncbi:ribonuclease HII [Candidatus Saccharibacteria bacterium]|nr:ribonuclease HII [Candidatus Saccharibacteria bacterium]
MAILGIDEVGRGPLAGPLVVGAVILPEERPEWVLELRDSKKLSAKKREKLNEIILKEALATGIGWVFPNELDEIGISEALRLATSRAVKSVQRLHVPFSQIIIDGKVNFLKGTALEKYVSTAVKADDLIKEVSASSIIAKVSRDDYMKRISERFPEYGFEKHVGYGTAKHLEAISKFGICPEHRKSFEPIKSMVGFSREKTVVKNTTMIGNKGEDVVVSYLICEGHEIIARNYKTKFYEVDIISRKSDTVYFTEVKYRKSDVRGGGLQAITKEKLSKMKFSAESFMARSKFFKDCSPLLAVAEVSGEDFHLNTWFSLDF